MASVRVEQRNAHLAGPVQLSWVNGREGKLAKAVLTAISNVCRGSGEAREEEPTAVQWSARSGSTAAPVVALGGTSAAEPPLLVIVRSAALQPPRQASWHIGRDAAPTVGGQPVRQSSHRAPPTRPRRIARGTCGGIFKRWAGKPAHCFGC